MRGLLRALNLLLSAGWVAYVVLTSSQRGGPSAAVPFFLPALASLGFLWFSPFWAGWLGPLGGGSGHTKSIDQPSPAWLIALVAWLILVVTGSLALDA